MPKPPPVKPEPPAPKSRKKRKPRANALPKFTQTIPAAGRPRAYDAPAHCARAKRLGLLGLTDAEIAEQFGISPDALYDWSNKYPEFAEALASGKLEADGYVADSHYQRALGFERQEVKIFQGTAETGPVYAPFMAYYPGDVGAQKSWLHNRQPTRWREQRHVEVGGTLEHRIAAMTREERQARLLELQAKMQTIEGTVTEVKGEE